MPHDANGNSLSVGDEVVLKGRVTEVCATEEYCNVTFQALRTPRPADCGKQFTTNAALLERVPSSPSDLTIQAVGRSEVIGAAKAVLAAFERDAKTEYQRDCERELRLAIAEAEKPAETPPEAVHARDLIGILRPPADE